MDDLNMIVPRRVDFDEPKLFCKSKVSIAADLIWSGRRGSNSRPQPWQGCALPTELLPQVCFLNEVLFSFGIAKVQTIF